MADNINALVPVSNLPTQGEWNTIIGMAQQLVPTGFLPKAVDSPQKAAAIMLKARELGVPPMYALSNIAVIQGKPTANAELMLALVKRAYGRDAIWVEHSSPKVAKVGYLVHGKPKYYEFTIEMAAAAKLTGDVWQKFPDAMLRARCISAVCRMEFPEVIGGMYVPGELGEDVRVEKSTGEVISVDYSPLQPTATMEDHDPKAVAMRRLHAVATKHGITHEDLHRQAVAAGRESLSDYDAQVLAATADSIEARPDKAKAYYERLRKDEAEFAMVNETLNKQLDSDDVVVDEDSVIQGELVNAAPVHPNHGNA